MRRLAWCALAFAAACGAGSAEPPGPLDRIRLPTGMAVQDGRVIVASSNADLYYDEPTGGTVISLDDTADPVALSTVTIAGGVRVHSFAGELTVARPEAPGTPGIDAEACGAASDLPGTEAVQAPLAVFATRGSNTLNVLEITGDGAPSCSSPFALCGMAGGGGGLGDPFGVALACGNGRARAFFAYMTTQNNVAAVAELDLATFAFQTVTFGVGPISGMAYDRDRDRLFMAGVATGVPTPLRWLELAGCTVGDPVGAGGCTIGSALIPALPAGLELRAIALAHSSTPGTPRPPWTPIRAYVTGRLYDTGLAASIGYRTTDLGGLLIVMDLVDDALGGVQPQVVWTVPIGQGAQDVKVLPRLPGWPPSRRDVVAALSVDEGALWIYDDETRSVAAFRTCNSGVCDVASGAPVLGHQPYGLAVDPVLAGSTVRVWVGSYQDSFVTPIDVTLDPEVVATFAGGARHHITGAMP